MKEFLNRMNYVRGNILRKKMLLVPVLLFVSAFSYGQTLESFGVSAGPSFFTGPYYNTYYPGGSLGVVFNLSTPVQMISIRLGAVYSLHDGKTITYVTEQNGVEYINPVEHEETQLLSLAVSVKYGRTTGPYLFIGPTGNRFTYQSDFTFGFEAGAGWILNRKMKGPRIHITLRHNALNLLKKDTEKREVGIVLVMFGLIW